MDKWNPSRYLTFNNQRLRPAIELLDRGVAMLLNTENSSSSPPPRTSLRVLDLGCGTGSIHPIMRQRLSHCDVHITAVDTSAAMLDKANEQHPHQHTEYVLGDVAKYVPTEPFDLIYSNATFHWLTQDENATLMPRLVSPTFLQPGGVLAFQVPYTREQDSHRLMTVAAEECGFGERVRDVRVPQITEAMSPTWFHDLLRASTDDKKNDDDCATTDTDDGDIDMWYTEYVQMLQNTNSSVNDKNNASNVSSPVADFTRSTGLQPMIAAIGGEDSDDGRTYWSMYRKLVAKHYPATSDGKHVLFPFKRFFVVTRTRQ